MKPRPPNSTRTDTPFPTTSSFRSNVFSIFNCYVRPIVKEAPFLCYFVFEITVCVANPRRSLWRCKLGGGGAGGYVSFGGGYAGVEGGYVAACRKVRLQIGRAHV